MVKAITRNAALLIGVAVVALVSSLALPAVMNGRGAAGPVLLGAQSQMVAIFAVLGVMLVGGIIAGLVGRATNAAVGVFVLGAGVFALSGRSATVKELVFGGGTLWSLPGETLVLAGLALMAVVLTYVIAGPLSDVAADADGRRPHPIFSAEALLQSAAGVLVLVVVWALAQSSLKGQVTASVVIGSMVAGLVGRLISPHVQPILLFISPIVFGALGQLLAATSTKGALDVALARGEMPHLAYVMPLDYLAGALIGVPMGVGWARSFLHHDDGGHS